MLVEYSDMILTMTKMMKCYFHLEVPKDLTPVLLSESTVFSVYILG